MTKTIAQTDNLPQIEQCSRDALPPNVVEFIAKVKTQPHPESQLIGVLHKVQAVTGYLGPTHLDAVAQLLGVPAARVSGVATFYHFFRLQPKGKYVINVCMGTACYVRGAEKIADRLRSELGIDFGQTTKDGLFTMEQARCVGMCGLAPVIMINDTVYAKATADQIPTLLDKCAKEARGEVG